VRTAWCAWRTLQIWLYLNAMILRHSRASLGEIRADWQLNLSRGVTPVSADIFVLHMLVVWICTAIGVLVYGMLAWILVRHRRSRHPLAAGFEDNRLLEIIWTAILAIIVIGIAIQSTEVLKNQDDYSLADVTIKVTVHRCCRQYEYLDDGVRYGSKLSTLPQ